MTSTQQSSQAQDVQQPTKQELNFRALESKFEKQLAQERSAREEAEKALHQRNANQYNDDEDSDEPYVDHKRLDKKLAKFGQSTQSDIQRAMEAAKQAAKEELKQEMWLETNNDFQDVMKHAEKLYQKNPKLAETMLKMPEGFDRTKMVYETIKELGLDKPERKEPSIQDKIDANRRSPYYQQSGVSTSPYSSTADFSADGQKQGYEKMQELKKNMRI
jgi:hypothetical protein